MQFLTTDDDVSQCIFLGLKVDILRYTMEAKLNLPIFFNFVIFWVWSALNCILYYIIFFNNYTRTIFYLCSAFVHVLLTRYMALYKCVHFYSTGLPDCSPTAETRDRHWHSQLKSVPDQRCQQMALRVDLGNSGEIPRHISYQFSWILDDTNV